MNEMAWIYLAYLGISLGITIWVARTLRRYGLVLMTPRDVGDPRGAALSDAMSHLLVVGFYLINLGVICFALKSTEMVLNSQMAIELLSAKVGMILVVLGIMHFLVLATFAGYGQTPEARRPLSPLHRERPQRVESFIDPEPLQ